MNFNRLANTDQKQRRTLAESKLPFRVTDVKTAAYRAKYFDCVLCDPTGGGFTVTLPNARDMPHRWVTVKNASESTNTITVDGSGSETIDGAANQTIVIARASLTFMSDGENWIII